MCLEAELEFSQEDVAVLDRYFGLFELHLNGGPFRRDYAHVRQIPLLQDGVDLWEEVLAEVDVSALLIRFCERADAGGVGCIQCRNARHLLLRGEWELLKKRYTVSDALQEVEIDCKNIVAPGATRKQFAIKHPGRQLFEVHRKRSGKRGNVM